MTQAKFGTLDDACETSERGENCWVNAKAEKKITVKITRARPGANRSTQGVVVVRQGMRDGSTTT